MTTTEPGEPRQISTVEATDCTSLRRPVQIRNYIDNGHCILGFPGDGVQLTLPSLRRLRAQLDGRISELEKYERAVGPWVRRPQNDPVD